MSKKKLLIVREGMWFSFEFFGGTEEFYTVIDVEKINESYYPLDVELEIRLNEKKPGLAREYADQWSSEEIKKVERAINNFMEAKKEAYRQFEKDTYNWK